MLLVIAFIVASGCLGAAPVLEDPPEDLVKRVAAKETATQAARAQYMYRQDVRVEDFHPNGRKAGEYGEVREVIFLEGGKRTEREVRKPWNRLERIQLTAEDFRDLRDVQPMLLTKETLFLYESKFKGEENVDGVDCWLLQIRPRQILEGQRLFDGILWVGKQDFAVVRSEGQAVPQIRSTKSENLFPHFTTLRAKVDGEHWFPVKTYGDDVLHFRTGSQRMRIVIDYANYKRFGAESTIRFDK
jgi:hypothetical protein